MPIVVCIECGHDPCGCQTAHASVWSDGRQTLIYNPPGGNVWYTDLRTADEHPWSHPAFYGTASPRRRGQSPVYGGFRASANVEPQPAYPAPRQNGRPVSLSPSRSRLSPQQAAAGLQGPYRRPSGNTAFIHASPSATESRSGRSSTASQAHETLTRNNADSMSRLTQTECVTFQCAYRATLGHDHVHFKFGQFPDTKSYPTVRVKVLRTSITPHLPPDTRRFWEPGRLRIYPGHKSFDFFQSPDSNTSMNCRPSTDDFAELYRWASDQITFEVTEADTDI